MQSEKAKAARVQDLRLGEFKQAFTLFDRNMDGSISRKEIAAIMRHLGYQASDAELDRIVHVLDEDGNGEIEFSEFLSFITSTDEPLDAMARRLFGIFDRDGNGSLSKPELRLRMVNLGERLSDRELTEMFEMADMDKDGVVTVDDFIELVAEVLGRPHQSRAATRPSTVPKMTLGDSGEPGPSQAGTRRSSAPRASSRGDAGAAAAAHGSTLAPPGATPSAMHSARSGSSATPVPPLAMQRSPAPTSRQAASPAPADGGGTQLAVPPKITLAVPQRDGK